MPRWRPAPIGSGSISSRPSPRFVTPETAASLSARLEGGPLRVGLFVEPAPEVIAEVLERVRLDILQIYGAADLLPAIRTRFGLPIWRAFGISAPDDLPDDPGVADRPGARGQAACRSRSARGECGAVRLEDFAGLAGAGTVASGRWPDTGQRRDSDRAGRCGSGRCLLRGRTDQGRQGPGHDPGVYQSRESRGHIDGSKRTLLEAGFD